MPIRKIRKVFKPPQAPGIAAEFRSAAGQIYDLAAELEGVARRLDPTWEGLSKDRFFADFNPTPNQIKNCASTLNRLAAEIEALTVTIEVEQYY